MKKLLKESLITSETAILAHKKGFPQENYLLTKEQIKQVGPRICTQSLLQKWLREVHNIHIYVWHDNLNKEYYFEDCDNYIMPDSEENPRVKSFEEALENGLQYGLKLIPDTNGNNNSSNT